MPALLLLEGFELHDTYNFDTYYKMQSYMGCAKVEDDTTTTLNGSTGDYVGADSAESRISGGRSWAIKRADTTGKNATHWVRTHFDHAPRGRVCVGFGWKSSEVPAATDTAYPLFAFNYSTQFGNEEQLGIWVTPQGGIFCADENMTEDQTEQSGPTPIGVTVSSSKEIVHGQWNYMEVDLNLLTDTPQLHVKVNNRTVIDFVQSADLQKLATALITNFAFIAPPMNYFTGATSLDFYFDDIYAQVTNEADADMMLGPQQIIGLLNGGGTGNGLLSSAPPQRFSGPATGPTQDDFTKFNTQYFEVDDPDVTIPTISGVAATVIAYPASGLVDVTVGVADTVEEEQQTFTSAAGGSAGPVTARFTTNDPPGNLTLDGAGLADVGVSLALQSFV